MNKNAKIALDILRAQNASDGGKRIIELVDSKRSYRDNCAGYGVKDLLIQDAIKLICSGNTAFRFSVTRDKDEVANFIVYFETRIYGKKYQVSFHTFADMDKYVANSFRIKWDRGVSRHSAQVIYRHYCPNGQYSDWQ